MRDHPLHLGCISLPEVRIKFNNDTQITWKYPTLKLHENTKFNMHERACCYLIVDGISCYIKDALFHMFSEVTHKTLDAYFQLIQEMTAAAYFGIFSTPSTPPYLPLRFFA